jgi:L-ascorbate metabolism protein UlaG (beta-lactamase superfamily)
MEGGMLKIRYFGHSAVQLSDDKYTVIIDPFLKNNPLSPVKPKDVKTDFIILTHGHGDHLGDTIEIAKANKATVIAVNELAKYCASKGVKSHCMHIGGSYAFPFGRVKFTIAHHGSSTPDGLYMGEPAGVLVTMSGKTVYHCGDTGLFYDMKLIGEMNKIDLMLVPVGDNFTMGIDDAVKAVELVKPKKAVPIHYNTFPDIEVDPKEFVRKVENFVESEVMDFGGTIQI